MLLLNDNESIALAQQTSNQRVLNLILEEVPLELLWDVNARLLGELSTHYKHFSQMYNTHLRDMIARCESSIASEYHHSPGMLNKVLT